VTVIPESPVTAAKRSSSCLSAVNDNDSCSANLPAAKRPRLSDADFFSVSTEPGFHSSRHDRRTLVPATEEDEQSQLQPTESAAVPDSDDFASNGTESNSFKNLICVDTALHDIVLPHEQLSPHMTEYLKFLEQSRLASVDCAAQVDTVSSSVVDSDMAMCDTDGRVSLPGSIDVDDESFVTVLPPALQIDSQVSGTITELNPKSLLTSAPSLLGV
jgi:hypothetical protein